MAWKRYERYEQQLQRKYGNSVHMAGLQVDEPISRQRKRPGVGPTVYEALPVVLNAFADAYSTSFQVWQSSFSVIVWLNDALHFRTSNRRRARPNF